MDKKKLKEIQDGVTKHFGAGSLMLPGDKDSSVEVIPTGIFSLDRALGIGGFPRGRMVEIFGPEATGKTSLALYVVAEAQKQGLIAAFVDAEHALDLKMAKQLGVNTNDLLISQPDNGEQALEIVEHLVRTGEVGVVVIDSVAALTPKAEIDGDMGDSHMGLQARLMSQCCRKIVGLVSKSNTTVVWINQVRMKIGVFFGNPETTTGGNSLKFYTSLRLEARRGGKLTDGDSVIGHMLNVKVVKNKLASPHTSAEMPLLYGKGIDVVGDIFDCAVNTKIIDKSGSWFNYGEEKLGQGRNQAIELIISRDLVPELRKKLNEVSQVST